MQEKLVSIPLLGQSLTLSCFIRKGSAQSLLFLHGLGCAKNDFYAAAESTHLDGYTLVGIDFPGCGNAPYPANARFGIDELVKIASAVIDILELEKVAVLGHSMGGVVGLLLSGKNEKINGFINVEGNLAGSDCFFSRKVSRMDRQEFIERGFKKYVHRVKLSKGTGIRKHGEILAKYTDAAAMHDVCPSLVHYSENEQLLEKQKSLPIPTLFIHGDANHTLPYLAELKTVCAVKAIANSGHFPFYDNTALFYKTCATFVQKLS